MKICRYCLQEQPESRFEVAACIKGKIYRRHKCRRCKRITQSERIQRLYLWFVAYKKTLTCSRCGIDDHRVLDFHHLDAELKHCNVSDMIRTGLSRKVVESEIQKCSVLCANCHRIEHYHNHGA